MAVPAPDDEVHRVVSTALDADFYRAVNRDLDFETQDPIRHYTTEGWRQGRDPAPWFSASAYLDANADIASAGFEPFFHFLVRGRREGRDVVPSAHGNAYLYAHDGRRAAPPWRFRAVGDGDPAPPPTPEPAFGLEVGDYELMQAEFDPAYYLGANPDVAASGMDPLEHFVATGWREGRNPTIRFSVMDYLEAYFDVAQSGMNPFLHYLRTGRTEGRTARSELGFRYEILANLKPMGVRVEAVRAAQRNLVLDHAETLAGALAVSRSGLRDLHVTVSHDDYTTHLGGVQLCLRREAARIAELGRDHLHLFPVMAWPVVRTADEPGPLGVIWNGEPAGMYASGVIADVLEQLVGAAGAGRRSFAIHSLLGHSADETTDILEAAGLTAGYFWLHDFASLCAGFHLMRNDVEDCAAPPPDSAACRVCVYGDWRARHVSEHRRLFDLLDLTVVSPSDPTLQLWRARWPETAKAAVVHPHVTLADRGPAPISAAPRPFRLAFAGFPSAHKGWPIFRDLALRHADDPRYVFLHLGAHTPGGLPLEFHPTTVTEARPGAMRETLESLEVDAALIWPLCRETFSLSAYEAVAAGAAVITGPDSGNVAAFVAATGHGLVLPDEAALGAALDSGEITALARARRRPRLYDLVFSGMTADLLDGARSP